jgi:hypothetical protein
MRYVSSGSRQRIPAHSECTQTLLSASKHTSGVSTTRSVVSASAAALQSVRLYKLGGICEGAHRAPIHILGALVIPSGLLCFQPPQPPLPCARAPSATRRCDCLGCFSDTLLCPQSRVSLSQLILGDALTPAPRFNNLFYVLSMSSCISRTMVQE